MTAASIAMLLPQQSATAAEPPTPPLDAGQIQPIGPGLYTSSNDTYEIVENDVPAGLMGRSHAVTGQASGAAQAQDAPADRSDLGVFGPSWEAEFLGGQLNRKLAPSSGRITVTDLASSETIRYDLTDSIAGPDGGSINTYTATDGSTLVENITWDDLAGDLKTTVTETVNVDLSQAGEGDTGFEDASGNPIPAADTKPTYTWKQVGGSGDTWRVTAVGSKAFNSSTVSYDAQGRVSTVSNPAGGENPAQSLKVTYSSATTASGSTLGDVAGQVKEITLTSGSTVQTLARYSYDGSGLLRKVANPAEGSDLNAYTYDASDRVATATSDAGAKWQLAYSGDSATPAATETTGTVPDGGSTFAGAPSIQQGEGVTPAAEDFTGSEINEPQANPSYCYHAVHWMWYVYSGCATKVAHYGWHNPYWKQTPTGYWVVGINHDHCTSAADKPAGWDFRAACDAHDYGYGTIGNAYKGYKWYLDKGKGLQADSVFYTTLYSYTCPAYARKTACRTTAYSYYMAVYLFGKPKNGANAT
ncbi:MULTISPECIES: phospholipase A2 [unclassified Streptomyces]|uniref:phospholipase A2 n=1 Tax=unclassified Streptomyces TaxID=2593676 RepID=UPI00236503BB|nr:MULTISPECIES: phospholipase A2 [unclassified Streptomyces]MDF3140670.1 phospholipase A2 [Streptomyces sp. T21Q-yed]WDF38507.1 phospholipase A2 [Streptomyces sp. T12]